MRNLRIRVTSGTITALSGLWSGYSHYTTAADLPQDASKLVTMLADPPIYLPWLIAAVTLVILSWSFWPAKHEPLIDQPAAISQIPPPPGPIGILSTGSGATITGNEINFSPKIFQGPSCRRLQEDFVRSIRAGPTPRTTIVLRLGDSSNEARQFRDQLLDVLHGAGWNVSDQGLISGGGFKGVQLRGTKIALTSHAASKLIRSFHILGVALEQVPMNDVGWPDDILRVDIGADTNHG